jgi:branched-chain amino acid transport system ATP-binding protein
LLLQIRDETNCSLVIIEHDMPLVTAIADRMIALELGHIIATGTPSEVVQHPAVVASYTGSDASVIARSGARGAKRRAPRKRAATASRR